MSSKYDVQVKSSFSSNISFSTESSRRSSSTRNPQKSWKWTSHKWNSNLEFLLITTFTCVTVKDALTITIKSYKPTEPCLGHYVVTMILIGIPQLYTHIFIGQYSQLGITFLKHLAPLGHGLSYCYILRALTACTFEGLLMSFHLLYFVSSFRTSLEWMECPKEGQSKIPCWNGTTPNCSNHCLGKKDTLSARIFFREIFMKQRFHGKSQTHPQLTLTVMAVTCWTALYFISKRGIRSNIRILKINAYIITTLTTLLLLVCILTSGAISGLSFMFYIPNTSLLNLEAWSQAVYNTLSILLLGQCFHVTYGSYMSPTMHTNILSTTAATMILLFDILLSCLIYCTMGIILDRARANKFEMEIIWGRSELSQFTTIPQGLGYLGASQLWTAIFFMICIFLLISGLVTKLDIIENCISEFHPGLKSYRTYTLAAICIIGCGGGIIFFIPANYENIFCIIKYVMPTTNICNIFVFTILVYWVYRVDRLSDDIHFLSGKQPTQYFKICWYLMPIFCLLPYLHFMFGYYNSVTKYCDIYYVCLIPFLCPLPICFILNLFKHLKMHNLVSMIQPDERWGPPDPNERHLRRMFNPREETKLRRRNDKCIHKCLLNSEILQKAIEDEDTYKTNENQTLSTIHILPSTVSDISN